MGRRAEIRSEGPGGGEEWDGEEGWEEDREEASTSECGWEEACGISFEL